ncbi:MAG TPA: VWA domain-containing protein, partial [Polyangia bacterium]|nr:VWA domain-containing protein [Polyangia bacterium]
MTDNSDDMSCPGGTMAGDGNCGATSKWAQVIAALNLVVGQTQNTVNWGLIFLGDEATVCGAATAPVVDITAGASAQPIQDAFNGVSFTGQIGTPTTAVMNNAVTYLKGLTDANPKYLLLATDGEPNCAAGTGTANAGGTDAVGAENAVAAAKTAGFPTFVVGIATSSDAAATNALNTMAVNGGEAQTGAATQYYSVTDTAGLETVLAQIVGKTVSCTIPLTGVGGNLDKVAVSAKDASGNTIEIMEDDTNGWSYTDPTKTAIILNGDACSNLKSVTYTGFQFIYTCATGVIVIG